MARGRLRGVSRRRPGVGKSYAMVEEGVRRAARGPDVMIGILDVTAARRSEVAAVSSCTDRRDPCRVPTWTSRRFVNDGHSRARRDLAHRTTRAAVAGSWSSSARRRYRVITTVNISNLESMGDVVAGIVGSPSKNRSRFRGAGTDQIELVDMSPEALGAGWPTVTSTHRIRSTPARHVFRPEVSADCGN